MSYQKHNFEAGAVLFASQINDMDNQIEFLSNQGSSFSDDFKTALLNCFENVAWINENGQTYYDALYDSLYPDNMWFITNTLTGCTTSNNATSIFKNNSYVATITANQGYTLNGATVNISMGGNDVTSLYYSSGSINIPSVTGDLVITVLASSAVTSISAVFTQGQNVIYETDSLDTLRQYLVVTATYSDSTTAVTTNYTLSGTLTEGTSTITVSYGGKTTTFTVTVTGWDFEWYATSGTVPSDITNNGVTFVGNNQYANIVYPNYVIPYSDIDAEIEIAWLDIVNEANRQSIQINFSASANNAAKIFSVSHTQDVRLSTHDSNDVNNSYTLTDYASSFHKYHVIFQNGYATFMVDGVEVHSGYSFSSQYNYPPLICSVGTHSNALSVKSIKWRALS